MMFHPKHVLFSLKIILKESELQKHRAVNQSDIFVLLRSLNKFKIVECFQSAHLQ